MTIKQALITKLKTVAGIDDVFLLHAPARQAFPYIVVTRDGFGEINTTHGGRADDWNEVFQIDIYSNDDGEAELLRNKLIKGLHVFSYQTWSGLTIYLSRCVGVYDNTDLEADGEQVSFVRQTMDLELKYKL